MSVTYKVYIQYPVERTLNIFEKIGGGIKVILRTAQRKEKVVTDLQTSLGADTGDISLQP